MSYLFSSESVSEGHPDKIADQISDSIIDHYLAFDDKSKVACETLVTKNQVILAGEVKSSSILDHEKIVRNVIKNIGYTKKEYLFDYASCDIKSFLHNQSPDINRGIEKINPEEQGAGDQGIMFGYACNETLNYIPLSLDLSHIILKELSNLRKKHEEIKYLRPDSKSQVTVEYSDLHKISKVRTIVISTQHDEFDTEINMLNKIKKDVEFFLLKNIKEKYPDYEKYFDNNIEFYINPTGKFVVGGPNGDTGLTGRKIIIDTYGGKGAHGGGAFSGKDPSKVDRSAAYACRHIAKNIVASGIADECLIQVSYAIGIPQPVSINVNTYGKSNVSFSDSEIAKKILQLFDLRPYFIENKYKLREPIYFETASYGHMGRNSKFVSKEFFDLHNNVVAKNVELFTWEKLDYVEILKREFKINHDK